MTIFSACASKAPLSLAIGSARLDASFDIPFRRPRMIFRAKLLCVAAVSGLAAFAATMPAQALTMQECSAKYKQAKEANTLNGQKWNDFRKSQCGTDATAT